MSGKSQNPMEKARALRKAAPYIALFLFFFLVSTSITNLEDDFVFKAGIERYGSFFGWVSFFSQNWGGRVIPQGLLVIILQMPSFVFYSLNALFWVLLLHYSSKCFNLSRKIENAPFCSLVALLIFVFIPVSVMSNAAFWKCANVLYLWGSAACLMAMFPIIAALRGLPISRKDYVISVLGCIYASSFEQVAVFMSVALLIMTVTFFATEKRVHLPLALIVTVSCVGTAFFYLLPGNALRSYYEILNQFQKYDMFSTVDKILLGLRYAFDGIFNEIPLVFFIMSVFAVIGTRKQQGAKSLLFVGSLLVSVYFAIPSANQLATTYGHESLALMQYYEMITPDTIEFGVSKKLVCTEILAITATSYLGATLSVLAEDRRGIIAMVMFFGGIATMMLMGFSPTVYASGTRPRFIGYLLFILVGLLSAQLVGNTNTRSTSRPRPRPRAHQKLKN